MKIMDRYSRSHVTVTEQPDEFITDSKLFCEPESLTVKAQRRQAVTHPCHTHTHTHWLARHWCGHWLFDGWWLWTVSSVLFYFLLFQRCHHHQLHQLFDQFLLRLCGLLLPWLHVPQAQRSPGQSCQRRYGVICLCLLSSVYVYCVDIWRQTLSSS